MHVHLAGVSKHHGAATVLDRVDLLVGDHSRLGIVGPNGIGKSTLLRLLAGLDAADTGTIDRVPAGLTAGYLEQEREPRAGETVIGLLRRRTGIDAAERDLEQAAAALAEGTDAVDAYDSALEQLLTLGGADLESRARTALAELGLRVAPDRMTATLSGGEAARLSLAAVTLSRFDVLLLDEPTNDLDFDGLERLERFLRGYRGALAVVSHDREFLDRTVTRIAEIDPRSRTVREWAGGWTAYETARDAARRRAYHAFEESRQRRRELTELLSTRRTEARGKGQGLGERSGGSDRRGTNALRTKVRQAERLLERSPEAEKPFEPWELQLTLGAGRRLGGEVVSLLGAVGCQGSFCLGPIDFAVTAGERVAITGRNGSGKSTLLAMLLGRIELAAGTRAVGRTVVVGTLGQQRDDYATGESLVDTFVERTGLTPVDARTLLAKFGLGATHNDRPGRSLSPGERTRALLAELQQNAVNLLVLDEPTNHLDLEAVEQLEQALGRYEGSLVVVSHDRRFLEQVAPTRALDLDPGPGVEVGSGFAPLG